MMRQKVPVWDSRLRMAASLQRQVCVEGLWTESPVSAPDSCPGGSVPTVPVSLVVSVKESVPRVLGARLGARRR